MAKKGIKLDDIISDEIVSDYSTGMSMRDVAKKYNVNFGSVGRILRRRGAKPRRAGVQRTHSLNEHYFNVIDSSDKAYFLGLLFADGCNARYNASKGVFSNEVKLELSECDVDIIKKFRDTIGYTGKIKKVDRSKYKYDGYDIKDTCRILFCSKRLSEKLEHLGMVQAKTHVLEPPVIDDKLSRDFIRGYFDGDGGISVIRDSVYVLVVGTFDMCEYIKNEVFENTGVEMYIYPHRYSKGKFYVRANGRDKSLKILDWLYKDDNGLHIDRKYRKFLELKSQ